LNEKLLSILIVSFMAAGSLPMHLLAEAEVGAEEILFMDIPVVITASKTEQSIAKAPRNDGCHVERYEKLGREKP